MSTSRGAEKIPARLDRLEHQLAGRPVLLFCLGLAGLLGLAAIGTGAWLVSHGDYGQTEISLFGNTFKSQSIGIAAIFCGVVLVGTSIRWVLKSQERLAATYPELDAEADAHNPPATGTLSDYPDWGIRELFFHIRPDLIDNPSIKAWETVGREVIDHFSTDRLKVWGRPIIGTAKRGPLTRIDDPRYWGVAEFTYWFLKEDGRQNGHTWAKAGTGFTDYADLQVNRAEALEIWPADRKAIV